MLLTLISALTCSVLDLRELVTDPLAPSSLLYPSASSWMLLSLLFDFARLFFGGAADTLRLAYSECGDRLRIALLAAALEGELTLL
jgi:hypothetical protein